MFNVNIVMFDKKYTNGVSTNITGWLNIKSNTINIDYFIWNRSMWTNSSWLKIWISYFMLRLVTNRCMLTIMKLTLGLHVAKIYNFY